MVVEAAVLALASDEVELGARVTSLRRVALRGRGGLRGVERNKGVRRGLGGGGIRLGCRGDKVLLGAARGLGGSGRRGARQLQRGRGEAIGRGGGSAQISGFGRVTFLPAPPPRMELPEHVREKLVRARALLQSGSVPLGSVEHVGMTRYLVGELEGYEGATFEGIAISDLIRALEFKLEEEISRRSKPKRPAQTRSTSGTELAIVQKGGWGRTSNSGPMFSEHTLSFDEAVRRAVKDAMSQRAQHAAKARAKSSQRKKKQEATKENRRAAVQEHREHRMRALFRKQAAPARAPDDLMVISRASEHRPHISELAARQHTGVTATPVSSLKARALGFRGSEPVVLVETLTLTKVSTIMSASAAGSLLKQRAMQGGGKAAVQAAAASGSALKRKAMQAIEQESRREHKKAGVKSRERAGVSLSLPTLEADLLVTQAERAKHLVPLLQLSSLKPGSPRVRGPPKWKKERKPRAAKPEKKIAKKKKVAKKPKQLSKKEQMRMARSGLRTPSKAGMKGVSKADKEVYAQALAAQDDMTIAQARKRVGLSDKKVDAKPKESRKVSALLKKIERVKQRIVFHEAKMGELRTPQGKKVTERKQVIAIALSEGRRAKKQAAQEMGVRTRSRGPAPEIRKRSKK